MPYPVTPSPIKVHDALKGAHFPAKKKDLIEVARHNGASEQILQTLRDLPQTTLKSLSDVTLAMSGQR